MEFHNGGYSGHIIAVLSRVGVEAITTLQRAQPSPSLGFSLSLCVGERGLTSKATVVI